MSAVLAFFVAMLGLIFLDLFGLSIKRTPLEEELLRIPIFDVAGTMFLTLFAGGALLLVAS